MSSNTPKTILVLTANPKGTTQLRLDEEVREIDAGLQRARQREQFVLKQKWAVRSRDIQRAMLDSEPSIVHFSGHGTGDEGLVFEDETGIAKLVDGESLAGLFELFAEQVECVVLNGCYSEVQATAIARHVNYVIGMNKALGDRAAIEFAVGFYDALGAGRPVEIAHKFGCAAIRLAGIPEYLTPVLKKKPGIEAGNMVQEAKQGVPTNQTALSNVEVGGNIKLSVPATPQFTPDRIILSSQDRSPVPPKLAEEIEDITSIQEQEQATFRDIASRRSVTPPPPFPQLNPGPTSERTSLRINRKQFLKWAGFGGAGLVTAVVTREIFRPNPTPQSSNETVQTTQNDATSEVRRDQLNSDIRAREERNNKTVQTTQNDATSEVRRDQLNSDIRAREERNNMTGGDADRAASDLESDVRAKLEANLPASQLAVEAEEGAVTVTGTVPTQEQFDRIETLAKEIKGVNTVANKATVAPGVQ